MLNIIFLFNFFVCIVFGILIILYFLFNSLNIWFIDVKDCVNVVDELIRWWSGLYKLFIYLIKVIIVFSVNCFWIILYVVKLIISNGFKLVNVFIVENVFVV